MEEVFFASLSQMGVLLILIASGFLLARFNIVQDGAATALAKLENWLFIPALVFSTFAQSFKRESLAQSGLILAISLAIALVFAALAYLVARLCTKDGYERNVFTYGLAFANFGFMGNAVVFAVFPQYSMQYLLFTLPLWLMIYVWGVPALLTANKERVGVAAAVKRCVNPMTVALALGAVIGLSGLQLPRFISGAVEGLSACMSPVAMVLTGITLCYADFKSVFKKPSLYAVTFVRLIVFPLLAIAVIALLPGVPNDIAVCAVCTLAMPLGLNAVVVPKANGMDTSLASGMVVFSHVLSAATIPLIFSLLMMIIGG